MNGNTEFVYLMMMHSNLPDRETAHTHKPMHTAEVSTARLEAFSDGVFAIAITLLILEIKIPDQEMLEKITLKSYLLKLWPEYFAYVLSFVMIGIYWANHHYVFHFYRSTNHTFNLLNVFFLMSIAFLPFPTAILGEYISNEEHRKTATIFYSVGIYLPALFWNLIWLYANHKDRLIDRRLSDSFRRFLGRLYLGSNLLYLLAIALACFSPIASICLNVLLTVLYMVPPKQTEYKDDV